MARSYDQNCPIALGLDVLGERWTLLILRELIGGARRYGDLRAELPGIASNLLADRLRELEEEGLVDRTELPPPIARTVYTLSEVGWRKVPPVVQAIATFGLDMVEFGESALTPLNGFLAGILLAFDPDRAGELTASYAVDIDGRRFEFGVHPGGLAAPQGPPAVSVTATAADLITARLGSTAAERKAALRRVRFDGEAGAVDAMRTVFGLSGEPGLLVGNSADTRGCEQHAGCWTVGTRCTRISAPARSADTPRTSTSSAGAHGWNPLLPPLSPPTHRLHSLPASPGPPPSALRPPVASSSRSTTGSGARTLRSAAVAAGLLTTAVLFWLAMVVSASVPAAGFLVPQTRRILSRQIAPGPPLRRPVVAGGRKGSNWACAAIGLASVPCSSAPSPSGSSAATSIPERCSIPNSPSTWATARRSLFSRRHAR